MAKTQPKIDDIKDLKKATDVSDGLMSKEDKIKLDSVYKPKGNIADKTALLALTNIKQGDVYNAQSSFNLSGQNVKAGDNIVCLSDAATSSEDNWDNLGGNIDFAAALSQALVDFSATSGDIISSNTILEAINMLAYDKHIHSNITALIDVSGVNTGDEDTTRIGRLINEADEKTTPVDADMVGLMDSASSPVIMKKLSWDNIKTTLKAYFDTLYAILGFYSVKVGSTYITAASNQDTIEFVAGTNVRLTPDAVGKKVTIASAYGIKVNDNPRISSDALNFLGTGGVQIISSFEYNGSGGLDLQLEFCADPNVLISFLGYFSDGYDLWGSEMGVYFLEYGSTYYNTPNPVCGTDTESQEIEGFLTHYKYNTNFHSFTFHDIRTNKMYISSSFWNGEETIWNDWKRLITCTDFETEEVPAAHELGKWDINLSGESSSAIISNFEKGEVININISAFENHAVNLGIAGIYTFTHNLQFIPPTPDSPQILFTGNGGGNYITTTAPAYLDPNTITTDISLIEFTFKVFYSPLINTVHTSVRNTIY